MIPQVAGEYKLVLVGDSAVGNAPFIQENPRSSASSLKENMMSICCRLSELTSSSEGSKLAKRRSNYRSGTLLVF